uniref:Uncharacterized protein n=1 Tax=Sphaerodactylus townsendi TaxID=933632 RepID=A0ACB8E4R7_9SAUR
MESPVSTPAVLPLHLLVPVVNSDISSPCEQIMVRTRSVGVNTCDVALATEPECLGPCEPGTSVNLEGIVWQETEDGLESDLLGSLANLIILECGAAADARILFPLDVIDATWSKAWRRKRERDSALP